MSHSSALLGRGAESYRRAGKDRNYWDTRHIAGCVLFRGVSSAGILFHWWTPKQCFNLKPGDVVRCVCGGCCASETDDGDAAHLIFCATEHDRAQNGMCGCREETEADRRRRGSRWGGRWGGLGCAKLLPRCPISRCEYIWQIKAKGFVLRKLAAAGSCQWPHQRHPLCFARGGVWLLTLIFSYVWKHTEGTW